MLVELNNVLGRAGELTLVDVGASGGTPRIWKELAAHAVYVGFDADAREVREERASCFRRAVYINKAIGTAASGQVRFYLTRSPYCSSTLLPNTRVTESFLSADSFIIQGECTAAVTTVAEAISGLGLSRVDWLKVDTQGTDLSIFKSLPDDMRSSVLAVDLEPGLRGAYVGEELFSDVHAAMQKDGFWLSRMDVLGFPRMRKSTLDRLAATTPDLSEAAIGKAVRKTPGWVECRYLRTLESLEASRAPRRAYLLLWAFALLDQQWGYCLDVAMEFAERFPGDESAATLMAAPLARIRSTLSDQKAAAHKGLLVRVKQRMKAVLHPVEKPTKPQRQRPPNSLHGVAS